MTGTPEFARFGKGDRPLLSDVAECPEKRVSGFRSALRHDSVISNWGGRHQWPETISPPASPARREVGRVPPVRTRLRTPPARPPGRDPRAGAPRPRCRGGPPKY